jgi:homoserine acetyltransferase
MLTASETSTSPRRLVVERPSLTIEGRELADVVLGGWAYGPEIGTAPAVIVVGGITASPFPFGDSDPVAGAGREAWWPALNAPDLIDPTKYTVLCPCWPGNGSTWRGFDDPGALAPISVNGLADFVASWLDGVGCTAPVTFIGASLGGMVGVAFAVRHPERCGKLIPISAGLRPDGWGTATRHLQRELVRDGLRNGDVVTGMSRARQLGMLTYRGRDELDVRFGKLMPGMNGQYINQLPLPELADLVRPMLGTGHAPESQRLLSAIELIRSRARTIAELAQQVVPYIQEVVEYDSEAVAKHWNDRAAVGQRLAALRDAFGTAAWSAQELEAILRATAEKLGVGAAKLIHPLRVALTGSAVSPGIFEVLVVLGRDISLRRLDSAIEQLNRATV